ncbi:SpoIIE family protein phosphatase [Streptomyces sp. NPDC058231]|uniref:SpoIIE family protein phosphatase n=1 Tax=Streptomyces sp. NPDC058231 TaxID=3346392 RepID=UPI0036E6ED7F
MSNDHGAGSVGGGRLDEAVVNAVFSQLPVGLHVFDPDLRLVRVNTAAGLSDLFPLEPMMGRPLDEVLGAFDVTESEILERAIRDELETDRPTVDLRLHVRSRVDPRVAAVVSAALFRLQDADGTVLGVAVALTDITRRAGAEARLQLLNRGAASVGTTLDVFRTAGEFCALTVPELADTVAVDVLDSVLRGQAPVPHADVQHAALRRAGFRSVAGGGRQGFPVVGEVSTYPVGTPHRQALARAAPQIIRHLRPDAAWLDPGHKRHARILAVGVHSMIIAPMRARGVVLGLACFYRWHNPVRFNRDDLALAEQLTSHAALCLDNARLYRREHAVARILQRGIRQSEALVPSAVEIAHKSLPAGAGGGWFDVLPLSGARVALISGDATGQLTNAAAAMGELRAAIAALSDLDLPPDEILERLHDLAVGPEACSHDGANGGGPDRTPTATCLYAVYDPVSRLCTVASAGHPAPVLLHEGGVVEIFDVRRGPALGQGMAEYTVVERVIPEGTTLLLYNTALLGDDRHSPLLPLERLRRIAAGLPVSLQACCDAIVDAIAPAQPRQDAYLLLARTRTLGAGHTASWTLPNHAEVVSRARRLVAARLTDWEVTDDLADSTALVVSELVTNAVRYAEGPIEVRLVRDRAMICEVTDDSSTAPQLRRALDTDEGGRGLFITAQLTQRWGVRPSRRGKTIWAELALSPPGTAPRPTGRSAEV